MSHAFARLATAQRDLFRPHQGMLPTPRAEHLQLPVKGAGLMGEAFT